MYFENICLETNTQGYIAPLPRPLLNLCNNSVSTLQTIIVLLIPFLFLFYHCQYLINFDVKNFNWCKQLIKDWQIISAVVYRLSAHLYLFSAMNLEPCRQFAVNSLVVNEGLSVYEIENRKWSRPMVFNAARKFRARLFFFCIKKKRCSMISNETNLHKRPLDKEMNSIVSDKIHC